MVLDWAGRCNGGKSGIIQRQTCQRREELGEAYEEEGRVGCERVSARPPD